MFNIMNLTTKTLVTTANDEGEIETLTFEDGKRAKEYADYLSAFTGDKHQVRRAVVPSDDWKQREQQRMDDGTYRRAVPELEAMFKPEHYAHMSKKRAGQIAYTKDAYKGSEDRQSVCTVEFYLTNLGNRELFSDEQVNEAKRLQREADELAIPNPVKFATTPDDIEYVYTHYAGGAAGQTSDGSTSGVAISCMRYSEGSSNYEVDIHPCRVYGAGDLAIAYIADETGNTTHRALCWPERKVYSRVYGADDLLHVNLKALGYSKSGAYYGDSRGRPSLAGAKLLRIECDGGARFVVPYLDDVPCVSDKGTHLILDSNGDIECQNTEGWSDSIDGDDDDCRCCDHCEGRSEYDDGNVVYTNRLDNEIWCQRCVDSNTFYCERLGNNYSENVDQYRVDGDTWSGYAVERYAEQCEYAQAQCRTEYHRSDYMVTVIVNEGDCEQRWFCDTAEDEAFENPRDGKWYANDLASETVPNVPWFDPLFSDVASVNDIDIIGIAEPDRCSLPLWAA